MIHETMSAVSWVAAELLAGTHCTMHLHHTCEKDRKEEEWLPCTVSCRLCCSKAPSLWSKATQRERRESAHEQHTWTSL